jgi:hypothetical protein
MARDYPLRAESGGLESPMSAKLMRPMACFSRGDTGACAMGFPVPRCTVCT